MFTLAEFPEIYTSRRSRPGYNSVERRVRPAGCANKRMIVNIEARINSGAACFAEWHFNWNYRANLDFRSIFLSKGASNRNNTPRTESDRLENTVRTSWTTVCRSVFSIEEARSSTRRLFVTCSKINNGASCNGMARSDAGRKDAVRDASICNCSAVFDIRIHSYGRNCMVCSNGGGTDHTRSYKDSNCNIRRHSNFHSYRNNRKCLDCTRIHMSRSNHLPRRFGRRKAQELPQEIAPR